MRGWFESPCAYKVNFLVLLSDLGVFVETAFELVSTMPYQGGFARQVQARLFPQLPAQRLYRSFVRLDSAARQQPEVALAVGVLHAQRARRCGRPLTGLQPVRLVGVA